MQTIHNKTVITKKNIFKSQQIWLLKSMPLVLLIAAALVLLSFRIKNGQFVFESIFYAVLGGIVIPLYIALVEIIMFKNNKKLPNETVFEYDFLENSIMAHASDGNNKENVEIKYSNIKKYKIEKKYISVLIDKSTSLLIDKGGFDSNEDLSQVEEILKNKVPKKLKKTKKLKK